MSLFGLQLKKIISGAQTGVDLAGLDVGLALDYDVGGFVPKGRFNEAGIIDKRYPNLVEMPTADYPARTKANIAASDGTLIFTIGVPEHGTLLTQRHCKNFRPCLVVGPGDDPIAAHEWIVREQIRCLNVAGPRESRQPGVHDLAVDFLVEALHR